MPPRKVQVAANAVRAHTVARFQYIVKTVLGQGMLLPCTGYLDEIAVYGDESEQVLRNTAEAIRRLAKAGYMLNFKKLHL